MKTLVTGGLGFIGSHLIDTLCKTDEVVSFDNMSTGTWQNRLPTTKCQNIINSTASINNLDLKDIDRIYHFGEFSRIVSSFEDSKRVMESNLHGTSQVLELWKKTGAQLIYSASSSGFSDPDANPYTFTKNHNVQLIRNYGKWFGLDYKIFYFYNVFGPRQIEEGSMATVVGIFLKAYREGRPLPIVSPGTQTRDFTHVDDIIHSIVGLLPSTKTEFNLRSGTNYSIIDIAEAFGDHPKELLPERRGERFNAPSIEEKPSDLLNENPIDVVQWIKGEIHDYTQQGKVQKMRHHN